jgi:hypothetical protein
LSTSFDAPEISTAPTPVDELLALVAKQPGGQAKVAAAKAAPAGSSLWQVLDRGNGWQVLNSTTGDLDGYAFFSGARVLPASSHSRPLWTLSNREIKPFGTSIQGPGAWIGFHIPVTGWYVINLQTAYAPPVSAWSYFSGSWSCETSFKGGGSRSYPVSYPMLVNLSASGYWHCFSYVVTSEKAWVGRITIQSIGAS